MDTMEEVKNLKDRLKNFELKNAKILCKTIPEPFTNNTGKKEVNCENDFTDDECLDLALLNLSDNEETWLYAVKSNPEGSQQDFPDIISWLRFATKPQGFADNLNDTAALEQSEMRFDSRTYTRPKRRLPQPSLTPELWGFAAGGGMGRWSGVTNASSNTTLSPLIDLDRMSQLDSTVSAEALQEYLRVSPQKISTKTQSSCAHIASDSSSISLQTPTPVIPMSRLQESISPQPADEANVMLRLQTSHFSADVSRVDTFDKCSLEESRTCVAAVEVARNTSQEVPSKANVGDLRTENGGNNNASFEESNGMLKGAQKSVQLNHNSTLTPPAIEVVNPYLPSSKTPPLKESFQPVYNSTPSRDNFIPAINGLLSDSPIKQIVDSYVSNSHLRIEERNPSPILSGTLPLCDRQFAVTKNVVNDDDVGNATVTHLSRDLNTTFGTLPTSALVNKSLLHHHSSSVLNATFSKTELPSLNTTFCKSTDGLNGTFCLHNPPEDDQTSSASDSSSFSSASNPIRSLGDVQNMARQQEQSLQPQNLPDPRLPTRTLRRQGFRSEEVLAPIPQGSSDDGNQSDQSDISSLTRSSAHSSPCRSTNNLLRNNNNNINRPSLVPAPKQIVNRLTQAIEANDVRQIAPPRQSLLRAPSARAPATAVRSSGIRPPSVNVMTGIPRPAVSRILGSRMPRYRGRGRASTTGNWTGGFY